MGLLDNKVAIVTGAARGIGRAIAMTFCREGARCLLNDLDEEPLKETAQRLQERGGEVRTLAGSIADPEIADQLTQTVLDTWEDLHILVNNAGIMRPAFLHKMKDEAFNLILDVNLRGTFYCLRAAARVMREMAKKERESGAVAPRRIVNISSVAGIGSYSGGANYAASKAGIIALTRTAARELGGSGILVNAVAPGITETRMSAPPDGKGSGFPEERLRAQIAGIPLGRIGQPEEVANAVLFFASDLSSYVSGQVLCVDGGGLPEI
jgi:3-oxoacyl-[acyl-carrier protein] reductase